MLVSDFRLFEILVATLTGVGALLLCLVAVDLASMLCRRLLLLVLPGAARAARFHAALAAYRSRARKRVGG